MLLRGENLTTRKLRDVSFELRRGEVLGVAGLVGSRRSELGAALFGIDRIKAERSACTERCARPRSHATPWPPASDCFPRIAA